MVTRWKNTEMGKKIIQWMGKCLKRKEIWLIPGGLGFFVGIVILWDIVRVRFQYSYISTEENIFRGIVMNLFFAAGITGFLKFSLQLENRKWNVQSEHFFQEWECRQRRWKRLTGILGGFCMLLAVLNFRYMVAHSWRYGNLSAAYLLLGTAGIQWILCNAILNSYMKKWLELYMENLEQIKQKSIESALRSEQMKVDLISNVSHDLKTPLTSMVGYIELIKKEELSDVLSDYVEVLSVKAQKLKEMIDSLFDLAKTSSGNVELKMEPMELNRLIEQVQADMSDKIAQSEREIVVMLTEESTNFISDSSYMYRIFQNLIENALKYSQENTRIFLKSFVVQKEGEFGESREKVRFEITNTSGYPMNFTKKQITERFVRGDESRTTEGNGLGLAIVNTYTTALGGVFDVVIDCDQFKASLEFWRQE